MSKSKLTPLGSNVLVRPLENVQMSKGGIVLPDSAKEKPQEGEVLAIGTGKWIEGKLVPLDVVIGDKVLFTKYAPNEVKVDGEELYILEEKDILAIVAK